ncbi:MAG: XrtA system polysaccharide deacetylase [Myxococcota bacterium]
MGSIGRFLESMAFRDGRQSRQVNAMTVDVEEYFTVQNLDQRLPREQWASQPLRAGDQTRQILDLFDARGIKATFFVLGWVAERHPGLAKEIHARGHEVAAHSYLHQLVFTLSPEEFRADLRRVKQLLEDEIGAPVTGYRAPTYSVTRESLWAHEILVEEGFRYSSSIFPITHDRYGIPDYARFPVPLAIGGQTLWEFPLTTLGVGSKNLPVAGGGYMRLLPAQSIITAIRWVNEVEDAPAIVYLHPWEIDPGIPRYSQGILRDFRGYVGLGTMMEKLDALLTSLRFDRVDAVLAGLEAWRSAV